MRLEADPGSNSGGSGEIPGQRKLKLKPSVGIPGPRTPIQIQIIMDTPGLIFGLLQALPGRAFLTPRSAKLRRRQIEYYGVRLFSKNPFFENTECSLNVYFHDPAQFSELTAPVFDSRERWWESRLEISWINPYIQWRTPLPPNSDDAGPEPILTKQI